MGDLTCDLALALITAGIYGMMAHAVARRTREIGLRMAVGSSKARVVRLVLLECLRVVGAGVVLGIPIAVLAMRRISTLLYHVAPVDTPSLIAAAVALVLTALAASAIPAWRATRLDPVTALRVQ